MNDQKLVLSMFLYLTLGINQNVSCLKISDFLWSKFSYLSENRKVGFIKVVEENPRYLSFRSGHCHTKLQRSGNEDAISLLPSLPSVRRKGFCPGRFFCHK